jgi:uncharacterized protein
MKSNVVDTNVWVALLYEEHKHHQCARRWYEGLQGEEAGLCRLAQVAAIRLLSTRAVMGIATIPAGTAWLRMEELLRDERVIALPEPVGLDAIWPTLLRYREPTPNLVNDAYLASFAMASGRSFATFDQGFVEFRGLEVKIID